MVFDMAGMTLPAAQPSPAHHHSGWTWLQRGSWSRQFPRCERGPGRSGEKVGWYLQMRLIIPASLGVGKSHLQAPLYLREGRALRLHGDTGKTVCNDGSCWGCSV